MTSKYALPEIWWDLSACNYASRHLFLDSEVDRVSSNLGIAMPQIPHFLLLKFMELELLQNTNGSSMINLTAFHSNPLSKYDTSASHAATHE